MPSRISLSSARFLHFKALALLECEPWQVQILEGWYHGWISFMEEVMLLFWALFWWANWNAVTQAGLCAGDRKLHYLYPGRGFRLCLTWWSPFTQSDMCHLRFNCSRLSIVGSKISPSEKSFTETFRLVFDQPGSTNYLWWHIILTTTVGNHYTPKQKLWPINILGLFLSSHCFFPLFLSYVRWW